MGFVPLCVEIICTFLLAASLLYRYGNWLKHHVIVTISVLIAWFFPFTIVSILPLDVSSTAYRQCLADNINNTIPSNGSIYNDSNSNSSVENPCEEPWSYVPYYVLPRLWRVVYWTSQCLTWIILPMMQSYTKAGNFSVRGKLKQALIDNAIYYGSYFFIVCVLVIDLALRPDIHLDFAKLKIIAITASNTWGLTLLVLLLGYGLVEVPRTLWLRGHKGYSLRYSYFKASKLSLEKSEAEDNLLDLLDTLRQNSLVISSGHRYRPFIDIITSKVPEEYQERLAKRVNVDEAAVAPTEKSLIKLHRSLIKAISTHNRVETLWSNLISNIMELEDIARNENSNERNFKSSLTSEPTAWSQYVYTPTVEWYWKCKVKPVLLRTSSVLCAVLSVCVVWSEVTFFNKSPVLSIFALFTEFVKNNFDYFYLEVVSIGTMAYLCVCAYYTVFKIKILNLYYLAKHHLTDEYSLIFSGMLLCRLTPPLCLNFLGLIHLDSHIIKERGIEETAYTHIMGHMDVISIISDGFNIYFPMAILILCLATYFSLGSRVLSWLGFQQFVGDDEITSDLVEEGKELIKREKRKRQRQEESAAKRKERNEKYGTEDSYTSVRKRLEERSAKFQRDSSNESVRMELLQDVEPIDYTGIGVHYLGSEQGNQYSDRIYNAPPRRIFDDV